MNKILHLAPGLEERADPSSVTNSCFVLPFAFFFPRLFALSFPPVARATPPPKTPSVFRGVEATPEVLPNSDQGHVGPEASKTSNVCFSGGRFQPFQRGSVVSTG